MRETGEENRTRESIDEKPPELDEEMWEENRKIMDIVDEKTFQPRQRQEKKNQKWYGKRKDLIKNKVLFSFQWGRTTNGSIHQMQAPRRSLSQRVRSPATCRLLAPLKIKLTRILSLMSYHHLTRFVARLFAGCPRFYLKSLVGLSVGPAIKWLAALPSSTAGPSCRRLSYCMSSHWRSTHYGSGLLESDYRESSYRRSAHRGSTHHRLTHQRCNVNKRRGRYGP